MSGKDLESSLSDLLGPHRVAASMESRLDHAVDASWAALYRQQQGMPVPLPDVVVWPESATEVAAIIALASELGVAIVPRGGGSGVQGGTLAMAQGIGMDLSRLTAIVDVDAENMTATVEAGVTGPMLQEALEPYGLMCAHDPGSFWRRATVGGWVAARGAGVTSTKYGKAEDIVVGLQIALPPGKLIRTLAMPSHAAGPGLLPFFVGTEGAFGVITELTLRLDPVPRHREFLTYSFPSVDLGLEACQAVMRERVQVAAMRLYDRQAAGKLGELLGHSADGVLFLATCEGDPRIASVEAELLREACAANEGTALGPALCQAWWEGRYIPHSAAHAPRPPSVYGTTDVTAPFTRLGEIYALRKQALRDHFSEYEVQYTAHFSHWYPTGGMIYDRFSVQRPPLSPRAVLALHREIWDSLTGIALERGAVLNDHHGIGRQLHRHVGAQYGEALPVLKRLKDAIDPRGIMNPGKLGLDGLASEAGRELYDGL